MYNKKITSIVLILSFILPLLIFSGSIDYFAPVHTAKINEIKQVGYLTEEELINFPGFYTIGVIIESVTGISSRNLTFTPIQLLPILFIYFLFIYKLSNDYFFASILLFIQLLTGVTGSPMVFFWPHGLGHILFYSILLILLNINLNRSKVPEFNLLLIILGSSLAFISYDLYGMLLIFLIVLFFLSLIPKIPLSISIKNFIKKTNQEYPRNFTNVFNYCLILIVIELGLSKFIYHSLVPLFRTADYIEMSVIDKFFVAYFSKPVENPIADMVLNYPIAITGLSIIKYVILAISILICIVLILKKVIKLENINVYDLFTTSYFISSAIFGAIRAFIGQIPITLLYFPGILCTIWLYRFTNKYKKWAIFVVSLLLIMVPISHYIYTYHNLVDKDQNMFQYIDTSAHWYLDHGNQKAVSDELTKNICRSSFSEYLETTSKLDDKHKRIFRIELISSEDVMFLVQKSDTISIKNYYIINYKLNNLSLNNWMILKSWKYSKDKIDNNSKIQKIYSSENVAIYY